MRLISLNSCFTILTTIPFLLSPCLSAQTTIAGEWKGTFMDQYEMVINFDSIHDTGITGQIRMYDGSFMLQNDVLSDIIRNGNECMFLIPDKQTTFSGIVDWEIQALTGKFTFPDGSKHPVLLLKTGRAEVPPDDISLFADLRAHQFSADELKHDLTDLYSCLTELHPCPYRYIDRDTLMELYETSLEAINTAMTTDKAYLLYSRITSAIGCSHTGVRPPVRYSDLKKSLGGFFPLRLYFKDDKAFYVPVGNAENLPLTGGNEIIAINGSPIEKIIDQVFLLIPSQGENITTDYNAINRHFNWYYAFIDSSQTFEIEYRAGLGYNSFKLSGVPLESLSFCSPPGPGKNFPVFSVLEEYHLGIISIPSFGIKGLDEYIVFLENTFTTMSRDDLTTLVIDLRDNAGGHPIFAAQLLSHLVNREFTYFRDYDPVPELEPLYRPMQPNEVQFNGAIYVFVNGGCLSTTGHLISLLENETDAVFVGEEPGSTFRCNDGSEHLHLPATGFELNVPTTTFETFVPPSSMEDQSIVDYPINVTVDNVLTGRDPYLEYLTWLLDAGH